MGTHCKPVNTGLLPADAWRNHAIIANIPADYPVGILAVGAGKAGLPHNFVLQFGGKSRAQPWVYIAGLVFQQAQFNGFDICRNAHIFKRVHAAARKQG